MTLKRLSAAALSLAVAAAALPAALAAETPLRPIAPVPTAEVSTDLLPEMAWTTGEGPVTESTPLVMSMPGASSPAVLTVPQGARYEAKLYLNGEALDASAIPAAPQAGLLPMRLLCEADHGSAEWYEPGNQGFFYLGDDIRVVVDFADCSMDAGDSGDLSGFSAVLLDGVTFLPADAVGSLPGVEVSVSQEAGVERIDVSTPNGTALMKLVNAIVEHSGMGRGQKSTPAEMEEIYGESMGFKAEYMAGGVALLPMMVSPDTLILGRLPQDEEALRASLEAYRKSQEDTFSWYLPQNLPKVQNAQFATQGGWFLFLIAQDAGKGVELFRSQASTLD